MKHEPNDIIYSMKAFKATQKQILALLMAEESDYPAPPDFWQYQKRTYYQKKFSNESTFMKHKESIHSFREDMEKWIDGLIDGLNSSDRVLVDSFVGAGKTTIIAKVLNRKKFRQVWFIETHEGADEISEEHFKGRKTVVLRSRRKMQERKELDCKYIDCFDNHHPLGIQTICTNPDICGRWDRDCEYARRRRSAFASDTEVLLMPHVYLGIPSIMEEVEKAGFDIIVIDENFLLSSVREVPIHISDIKRYMALIADMEDELQYAESKTFSFLTKEICNALLKHYGTEDYFSCRQFANPQISNEIRTRLVDLCQYEFTSLRKFIPDLSEMIIMAASENTTFWWNGDELVHVQKVKLPENIPCLFLDAEGDPRQYHRILDMPVKGRKLEAIFKPPQTARIIQFSDGKYGKSTFFEEGEPENNLPSPLTDSGKKAVARLCRLTNVIERNMKGTNKRIALITHLDLEPYFRNHIRKHCTNFRLITDDPKPQGCRDDTEHFFNLRGTNEYKGHTALIIIGTPFLSPDAMVNTVRKLYNLYDADQLKLMREDYDQKAGSKGMDADTIVYGGCEIETTDVFSYNDIRMKTIYEMTTLKELYQAIGRIRPYRELAIGEEATVYLITNIPIRWYEVEKPRPRINQFLRCGSETSIEGIRKDVLDKLKAIAHTLTTMKPSFNTDRFYQSYEQKHGSQSTKQREILRDMLREYAGLLGVVPPDGKKRTFKKKGRPAKELL